MPRVRPFKGIRPVRDKVHLVVSRSYITYEPRDLVQKLDSNPYSFIHIINPDHGRLDKAPANSDELFRRIKNRYQDFVKDEVFQKEESPAFYLYEQAKPEGTFLGLICGTSVLDYEQGQIKKHEQTISAREAIFANYLSICDINAEPVLLTYDDNEEVDNIQRAYLSKEPAYDFTTTDRTTHRLWVITEEKDIAVLTAAFAQGGALYIADGHHRSASSAALAARKRQAGSQEENADQFFMSYLVPKSQMRILEFNRLVKDLNGLDKATLLERLQAHFLIEQCDRNRARPQAKGEMAMYIDGQWYGMHLKEKREDTLESVLCTELILEPVLGISDLRTDRRIGFIGGQDGLEGVERQVNNGKYALGIVLFPVKVSELMGVADRGEVMPPKSTWVEPKLRSGLVIYSLEES